MTARLDGDQSLPTVSPVCTFCSRLVLDGGRTCAAFPQGIPYAIWSGENDHTESFAGDQGMRFDPVTAAGGLS